MIRGLVFSLIAFPTLGQTGFRCFEPTPPPSMSIAPKSKPSYWVTVSPDGQTMTYMADRGNMLIDVGPGSIGAVMKAPGKVDVQFSADGRLITIVNKHNNHRKQRRWGVEHGTSWYSTAQLLAHFNRRIPESREVFDGTFNPGRGVSIPRLAIDREFFNHYHSMGAFKDASGRSWIRILNDYRGASIRDYQLNPHVPGSLMKGPIVMITSDGDAVDRSGRSVMDLPMMSKDGQFFAAYNRHTMTTQIFKIENHRRRLVVDLELDTGKVSFNYFKPDDPFIYIAFHTDLAIYEEGNKMPGTMLSRSKDILVYRLERTQNDDGEEILRKHGYARLTAARNLGEGSYYPQWDQNDNIFYVRVTGHGRSHRFEKVAAMYAPFQPFNLPTPLRTPSSPCLKRRFNALVALGYLYTTRCTTFASRLSATSTALYAFAPSKAQCEALAQSLPQSNILGARHLFTLRPPHSRAGSIRPDGRWTQKGGARRELVAHPQILRTLTVGELMKHCYYNFQRYDKACKEG